MKKVLLLIAGIAFVGMVAAQNAPAEKKDAKMPTTQTATKKDDKAMSMMYECPKCHMKMEKAGKCSHCGVECVPMKDEKAPMKKEEGKKEEKK